MAIAFIGLGSNLGDREAYLRWAVERLTQLPETKLVQVSRLHETEPVGGPLQAMYLNGVAQIQTGLSPEKLLFYLQETEQALGRPRQRIHWGPRVIDLDLLSYNDLILETPQLILPHPRMHDRRFVLIPLAEIAPSWVHPRLQKTAQALLATLEHANPPTPR